MNSYGAVHKGHLHKIVKNWHLFPLCPKNVCIDQTIYLLDCGRPL